MIDDTWTVDGGHLTVEPHKTSDVYQGPNTTDEWPEWLSPAQGAPDGVAVLGPLLFEDRGPGEQVFEDCETPPEDCHSIDTPAVSDETLQDQRRYLHRETCYCTADTDTEINGLSPEEEHIQQRHVEGSTLARGRGCALTDLVWDT